MARRKANSTNEDTFLFVNSDASTIKTKRRNTKLGQQIQRHVQRGVRQKLLAQEGSKSDNARSSEAAKSTAHRRKASPETMGDAMCFDFFLDHECDLFSMSPISDASMAFDSSSEDLYHSSSTSEDGNWELPRLDTTPIPQTTSSPAHVPDTPQSTVHESPDTLAKYVPALLRCWADRILPERFFFDAITGPLNTSRHSVAIADEIGLARIHPAHFYSLLASIAVQMTILGEQVPDVNQDDLVLWLKAKALEAIRNSLSQEPMAHELARDIQRLTTIALLTDMPHDAEGHFNAMMALVTSLAGLSSFDSYFVETEIIIHWYGSLRTLDRPRLTVSNTVPEPEEVARLSPPERSASPVKDPALTNCFQDLVKVIRFIPLMEKLHSKWLSTKLLSIGYRLLKLSGSDAHDEAFRIACIFFIALTRSEAFDRKCAARSIHHLRRTLDTKSMTPEMLLWIAIIGSLVATGTGHEDWFVAIARNAVTALKINSFEKLEQHLAKTIYSRDLLRESTKMLWEDRIGRTKR